MPVSNPNLAQIPVIFFDKVELSSGQEARIDDYAVFRVFVDQKIDVVAHGTDG
jgi:hypothetical protein